MRESEESEGERWRDSPETNVQNVHIRYSSGFQFFMAFSHAYLVDFYCLQLLCHHFSVLFLLCCYFYGSVSLVIIF